MNKLIIALVLLLVVTTACNIQWVEPKYKYNSSTQRNATPTNQTNETVQKISLDYAGEGIYFYIAKDSLITLTNKSTIVVDVGGYTAINILRKYDRKPTALILTLDTPEKTENARNFALSFKPPVIFDNGLPSPQRAGYLKYQDRLNITSEKINTHKSIIFSDVMVEFFVPFEEHGFFEEKAMNSIPLKIENLLYMSECYGACEIFVNAEVDHIVLANYGECNQTNSLEFILDTGAKYVYGTENLCGDLEDLNYFAEYVKIGSGLGVKDVRKD